jgi:hypothetical protein
MLELQREVGNRAVGALLAARAGVQRQPGPPPPPAPAPTVAAAASEVVPSGTTGTNTTTVTITGTPKTSYRATVAATDSRGHGHTNAGRPLGTITPAATVKTSAAGAATVTYTSSRVAGIDRIAVKQAGAAGALEGTVDVTAKVAGLTSLGTGAGYDLIGATSTHGDNHYGVAGAITAYQAVGTSWAAIPGTIAALVQAIRTARALPKAPAAPTGGKALTNAQLAPLLAAPTQAALEALSEARLTQVEQAVQNWPMLGYNDMSEEWGGLFDINGTWAPPHAEHREGRNMDFRLSNLGALHRLVVEPLMTGQGINVFHENAAHWHLTAP